MPPAQDPSPQPRSAQSSCIVHCHSPPAVKTHTAHHLVVSGGVEHIHRGQSSLCMHIYYLHVQERFAGDTYNGLAEPDPHAN